MFKILVPAVAAIGLVALAAKTQAVASEDTTAVTQSIAAEPVLGWYVSYEGSMAKLAYGVANSDQLSMMVTCAPGDRSAVIYGDVVPASPHIIQASTGGEAMRPECR